MRLTVLIAIVSGLFLVSASGLCAGDLPGGPGGWAATPSLHVKGQGGPVKNMQPDLISGFGYRPSQIKAAYGISGTGAGQTIAIVEACGSPTIANDLAVFNSKFHLPRATLNITNTGGVNNDCQGDNAANWALETSLDVEWAHALAPGATIQLVVATSDYFSDLFNAVQYAAQIAQVVSMSWGGDEFSDEASADSALQHPGTVFVAASGDSGSGAQYPAASPNVVAAGGTTLYLKPGTGVLKFPETAWEGSGGGVSQYELIPSYQATLGLGGGYRCIPDVSFAADPNTGVWVYDQGWSVVGGTSVATPCWAAIVALVNQARAAKHQALLTDGHQELYDLAVSSYGRCYRDITAGFNGDFAAGYGYDLITGLGSPKAKALVPALRFIP